MKNVQQQQPQAVDLEQAVLGACLIDRAAFSAICDLLTPDSFFVRAHAEIYRAFISLTAAGEPIDLLTVSERLKTEKSLKSVGGSAYLAEMSNRVASSANIEYHARIVAQKHILRRLIETAEGLQSQAYGDKDPFEVLAGAQKDLFELTNFSGKNAVSAAQAGVDVLGQIARAMRKTDGLVGVPSGFRRLDESTGGWQAADLVIIAARPGMGKTAFALCNALNAAKAGVPVAIFSLEMSTSQLYKRLVAMETGISSNRIQRGLLSEDEHRRCEAAVASLSELPIYIDDSAGLSAFALSAKARRLKASYQVGLIIVDYLQLMSGDARGASREQEVSGISRSLKGLAKDLGCPVIALSQLSRAVESRPDRRPRLSDLRESGALEQDADIVAFLYREDYYESVAENGQTELLIEKHRNGSLDTIGLHFEKDTTKFSDPSVSTFYQPRPVDHTIPASARPDVDEYIPF